MRPGLDYVGVAVGAMIFDDAGRVFLARRGPAARNEIGRWEFPGGAVEFGEPLLTTVHREFDEEYGMQVEVIRLLGVFDDIMDRGREHWVSATYIGRHVGGLPGIREPDRCTEIGWYVIPSFPSPLSHITQLNLRYYLDSVRPPSI